MIEFSMELYLAAWTWNRKLRDMNLKTPEPYFGPDVILSWSGNDKHWCIERVNFAIIYHNQSNQQMKFHSWPNIVKINTKIYLQNGLKIVLCSINKY